MRVKKYRAPDRATALKQIKAELGSDAMIVHEQSVRARGGPLGLFGKPEVEITAAIEDDALAAARQERARAERPREQAPARTARKAAAPAAAERDGVQATISSAGRRASSAVPPPDAGTRGRGDGGAAATAASTDRLAAILAALPKNGEGLSPEVAAQLADVIAQAADGKLGDLLQASAAGVATAAATERPPAAPAAPAAPAVSAAPIRPTAGGGLASTQPAAAASAASAIPLAAPVAPAPGRPSTPGSNGKSPTSGDGGSNILREMQRTLSDLRGAVERLTRQSRPAPATREAPALRTIYHRLVEQEVEPGLALELMGQIADQLGDDDQVDAATVESKLLALLRPLLPTRSLTADHRPLATATGSRVIVLVGPTGVGKTTTVAKLAAYLSLLPVAYTSGATGNPGRKQVCLVTTDTFRIAAAAQLGTYADIMRLPLEVVYAANELPDAIRRHADADYVIVDTPGCGQHNEPQLKELAGFVGAATTGTPNATVLMAVAAPTKLSDMLEVQQRFGALNVDGIVLTKLDETRAFGPLLSLVRRAGKPVFYVTTGQNVPNDIEEASSDALARLIAGALTQPTDLVGAPGPVRREPVWQGSSRGLDSGSGAASRSAGGQA